jgi:hypothetical protein
MQRHDGMGVALAFATLASCTVEDQSTATTPETVGSESSSAPTTTLTTTNDPKPGDASGDASVGTNSADGDETTVDPDGSTGSVDTTADSDTSETTDTSGGSSIGMLPFEESFDGFDGAPWPSPWAEAGSAVVSATIDDGRGHLVGATGQVARMVLPGFEETDVDISITVTFDDWTQQGFGLYVRQNGGALHETDPPGQGYATYVEGGFMQSIGIWRETNGVEELLAGVNVPGGELAAGVPYRLRLQCRQEGSHTRLRTRMWPLGQDEPSTWQVDMTDDTPVLQGTAGSFAVDVYNYAGMGGVLVDDLYIASAPVD